MKILFIDRCKESRYQYKSTMPSSYAVITLSSIKEALAYIQCHSFDVVVVSLDDPTANEATTFLRLVDCYAINPYLAVALTHNANDIENDLLLDSGFATVIKKPISASLLRKVVEEYGTLKIES